MIDSLHSDVFVSEYKRLFRFVKQSRLVDASERKKTQSTTNETHLIALRVELNCSINIIRIVIQTACTFNLDKLE